MKPKISFSEEQKDWIKRPLLSNIEKILDYRGRTPKKLGLSWSDTGFLALSALNVKNGYIDFNADANYGDQELYDRWMGDNHLHKGQVVFTTEAPMGNVAQIPNDDLYILSQRTIAFEVKHHLIREDFLATLLRSPKIFNELTSLSSGGTAKGVSQKSLSNLKVCVPASLDEQQAIGSLFRTLDDLLASYKENLTNYQSLKATMLSEMFPKAGQTVPEIRLDGFEGEWKFSSLGEQADITKLAGFEFTNHVVYSDEGQIPAIRGLNVKNQKVNLSDVKYIDKSDFSKLDRSKLIEDDLLFTYVGTVGEVARVPESVLWYLAPNVSRLRLNSALDSRFVLYQMASNRFKQKQIFPLIATSSQPALSMANIRKFIISFPTLEEQQAIGSYFSNLDNLINSHQEKISQLETLKKKFLQDMFV